MVDVPNRFTYPDEWNKKRIPVRPKELQVFDFEKNYDWDSIWNDVIQISEDCILLIGPPLYTDLKWMSDQCWFTDHTGQKLSWYINELDRACMIKVTVNGWIGKLTFVTPYGTYYLSVSKSSIEFGNKKVIVTITKNHPIEWLEQWIDYHKVVHNLDGVLLYDNGSTNYTSEHLETSLQRSDMTIKVVDYNIPFGCMGGGDWEWEGKSGNFLPWDSDFSQYVMLEMAKWKYLYCAKLVINGDTDELLITHRQTLDEIANYCQTSTNSVWLYQGKWIEPIDSNSNIIASSIPLDDRKFYNYWHTSDDNHRGIGIKWMLNPHRNLNCQWHLHRTMGPHMMTDEIEFGHFLPMNTSWSWKRDDFNKSLDSLREYTPLKQNIQKWLGKH